MKEQNVQVEEWKPEEVAERAARGDAHAFGSLYERYNDYVQRTAFGVLGNTADAEDVAQTVWSKLLRNLRQYTPEARFTTWLHRVVTHAAIDHTRQARRDRNRFTGPLSEDQIESSSRATARIHPPDQELDYLQQQVAVELDNVMGQLRRTHETRARCFDMYYLREMSVREIAQELCASEGTVKSHLFYCRKYISENHPVLSDLHFALQEKVGKHYGRSV